MAGELTSAGGLPRYEASQPVSVVLICHNKTGALAHVIAGFARNTRRPDLVVLSDDASTDGSPELVERLCDQHGLARLVVRHGPDGRGFRLNTLRNDGISACPEGLVVILDADHVPARTHLEAHRELHLRYDVPTLSTGPRLEYANPDCSGPINFMWGHEPVSQLQASQGDPIPSWTGILASNMGMAKAAFAALGGFDPRYDGNYGYDDIDFTFRASAAGVFFAASIEAHVIHIPHPAFDGRQQEVNRRKFREKYGFELTYPEIVNRLSRRPWSEHYRALRADLAGPAAAAGPSATAVRMVDLEMVGGRLLARALVGRLARRLLRRS